MDLWDNPSIFIKFLNGSICFWKSLYIRIILISLLVQIGYLIAEFWIRKNNSLVWVFHFLFLRYLRKYVRVCWSFETVNEILSMLLPLINLHVLNFFTVFAKDSIHILVNIRCHFLHFWNIKALGMGHFILKFGIVVAKTFILLSKLFMHLLINFSFLICKVRHDHILE